MNGASMDMQASHILSADDVAAVCAPIDQEEATGHVSVRNLRAMFNKGASDAETTPVKRDTTPKFPRRPISRGTRPLQEVVCLMAADEPLLLCRCHA